ncbi:TPA: hypothetical protein ENS27_06570 [bacterium]|nr:hypothetical protein [bacterium]
MIRDLLLKLFSVEEDLQFFHWQLLFSYLILLALLGLIAFSMKTAYREMTGSPMNARYLSLSLFFIWAISLFFLIWNPFGWLGIVPVVIFLGIMILWFLFSLILSFTALKKS